ncbi:MAG: ABC transporter permease [Kofleriaceae bacterium]
MSFEARIGWRYLRARNLNRTMLTLAGVALAVMGIGLIILLSSHGTSGVGVAMFTSGLLAAIVFALLSAFSVFTSVSVLGVALGVAALTIVLAVTTGFQHVFREKLLGLSPHVLVMKSELTFPEYREVMTLAKQLGGGDVIGAQPFMYAEMLITTGNGKLSGVAIKGIDPVLSRDVFDLDKFMVEGSLESLAAPRSSSALQPAPIIIGNELARKLGAKVGDEVTIVVPLSNLDPETLQTKSAAPTTRKFRVSGVFNCGYGEYDRRWIFTALADVQSLQERGDEAVGVELRLADVEGAAAFATKLEEALGGPPYQVQDWHDLNHSILTSLTLQKRMLAIILTLIILVAAINMVSSLSMMVTDKTREVAILKSMGARHTSVGNVFKIVGIVVGAIGTLIGVGVGLTLCLVVAKYGYRLDSRLYQIDRLPISVVPLEVVLVAGIAMTISVLATIVPSRAAASLHPVDGLRYD